MAPTKSDTYLPPEIPISAVIAQSSVFGQVVTHITDAPAFAEAHSGKEGARLQTESCEQPIAKDESPSVITVQYWFDC